MTTTFTGEVRIPGSIENGLPSTITLDAQTLILTAGGTELGRWNRSDLQLRREPDGTFHLTLGREVVLFNPDSPLEFAILSGMPGAGTVPAPAPSAAPPPEPAAPAAVPEAAPQPAAAPPIAPEPTAAQPAAEPPVATPQPAATPTPAAQPVAPVPAATTPPPAAPGPAVAAPAASMPPAAPSESPVTPPPATTAPPPAPQAGGPPPAPAAPSVAAAPAPSAQPVVPGTEQAPAAQTSGLPPASPAAAAAVAAAASVPAPATRPEPVEIRLETDDGASPSAVPPAPAPPAAQGEQAPAAAPRASDFWDGFHAEEQEAGVEPPAPAAASMAAAVDEASAEIRLEQPDDETEAPRVGGYGSGLFSEEEAPRPPAFGGADDASGDDRSWSYYEDEDGEEDAGTEDRGWSYDDPEPEEEAAVEDTPEFRSPVADRDDLVEKSSRMKDVAAWRPSMPSFSLGGSELGMRARDAISVLDAILEENGTEDIPKSFLIGLGGLAVVLAILVVLALIF